MNKYESNIMVNTVIMKVLFVIVALVNLCLPYYKDWHWTFSVFQFAIVVIWFIGLLGGLGYFNQNTPILPVGICRVVQILIYLILKHKKINWIVIGIFITIDLIFMLFLLFDKANYIYVTEEANEDEN